MTHLCYTLQEAAERLSLSETVLVRLSQYFKVPKVAYEEMGYLSFKGDLTFSDQDIAFFQQVKERLLVGESLDEVKSRLRYEATPSPTPHVSYQYDDLQARLDADASKLPASADASKSSVSAATAVPPAPLPAMPLQEVEDRTPYKQAAAESFERYKSSHRTGLGKVFEKMMREVGETVNRKRGAAPEMKPVQETPVSGPDWSDMKDADSILPFRKLRQAALQGPPNVAIFPNTPMPDPAYLPSPLSAPKTPAPQKPSSWASEQPLSETRSVMPSMAAGDVLAGHPTGAEQPAEEAWEGLIRQAASRPRPLNTQLKNAAALLRERALAEHQDRERRS